MSLARAPITKIDSKKKQKQKRIKFCHADQVIKTYGGDFFPNSAHY